MPSACILLIITSRIATPLDLLQNLMLNLTLNPQAKVIGTHSKVACCGEAAAERSSNLPCCIPSCRLHNRLYQVQLQVSNLRYQSPTVWRHSDMRDQVKAISSTVDEEAPPPLSPLKPQERTGLWESESCSSSFKAVCIPSTTKGHEY